MFRSRHDAISVRWQPRTLIVCGGIGVAVVIIAALSLTTGDYPVSLGGVINSLVGRGSGAESFIVITLRLPRLVAALLIGAALGMSGSVFQSLSRNPLGSPDIVGFTSGAASAAVLEILVFHGGQFAIAVAAIIGGLITAMLVYLLSLRRGRIAGYRLILVGIGIGAMLASVTSYLLTRASLYDALNAQVWLIGSLNAVGWNVVTPLAVTLIILTPITVYVGRALSWMELGDDAAKGLGVPVERTRLVLIITGTALAAAATAAAGPIGFVALASPQLCRRLIRTSGPLITPAAVMGAFLLSASDFGAQRVIPSTALPVGVMTGVIGGGYLCWLLAHELRAGRS
ncbi:ABC transporter permease [Microlunatus endophyticus]|uniref:ABC transporter permease n=1 Tax=Microlunatus endophyticus TaxID=1716077 RepID=A0A917W5R4_9ACTN|nr:ABC transporter permease [Microlunatus endophyticus]